MQDAPRYAIYFVPAASSSLYRFGSSVIGYDCYSGKDVPHFASAADFARPWAGVVKEARRYGFHATLKAPFRLREGTTEKELLKAVDRFAGGRDTVPYFTPVVRSVGTFVAIVPATESRSLHQLAEDCVTAFDEFRAPMQAAEHQRRISNGLTQPQLANLDRWGYPYVFEAFRFHMTLTGSLDAPARSAATRLLDKTFSELIRTSEARVDTLSLLRQDAAQLPFSIIGQWRIGDRDRADATARQ